MSYDIEQVIRDARASRLESAKWDVEFQRKEVVRAVEELHKREARLAAEEKEGTR